MSNATVADRAMTIQRMKALSDEKRQGRSATLAFTESGNNFQLAIAVAIAVFGEVAHVAAGADRFNS